MEDKAKCKNCTDEMIEEMAKDFKKAHTDVFITPNYYKNVATKFFNLNYRKIPEGSVVLDRQEHQKYCAYKIIEPQIKGCLDRERELEKQVAELEEQRDRQAYIAEDLIQEKHRWTEQERKETAKEILQELWHSKLETTIEVSSKHNKEDIKIACLAVVDLIRDKIQEIAKQYDVEVKE